jgi:hypothetical protein
MLAAGDGWVSVAAAVGAGVGVVLPPEQATTASARTTTRDTSATIVVRCKPAVRPMGIRLLRG